MTANVCMGVGVWVFVCVCVCVCVGLWGVFFFVYLSVHICRGGRVGFF